MKLAYSIVFFCIIFFCKNNIAQTIVVINIQLLIDENRNYIDIIKKIEKSQQKYLKIFETKENELKNILDGIEESKLILTQSEINSQIENYNNQLSDFSILVEEFNLHYQNQIINIRESVLNEIISLLEKYAIENNIDLILDSTSYLIASNSLDITSDINDKLKKLNLQLEYKDFENN